MNPSGASGPGAGTLEWVARLDQRDAFGPTSPRGRLGLADGTLSWHPDGWGAPVWHVPAGELIGGAAAATSGFELWLESPVTGTVAVTLDPPGGRWAVGGANAPDVRGQVALDSFVAGLRAGGARVAGEPRSLSSRPGAGGFGVLWPG